MTAEGVERESARSCSGGTAQGATGATRDRDGDVHAANCGEHYPLDEMVVIARAAELRGEQRFSRKSCDLRVASWVARFTFASRARLPAAGASTRRAVR